MNVTREDFHYYCNEECRQVNCKGCELDMFKMYLERKKPSKKE